MPPLAVTFVRVQALSVPVMTLPDRRAPDGGHPVKWVFLRDLEAALYGNPGASTGAVHRLLGRESLYVLRPPLARPPRARPRFWAQLRTVAPACTPSTRMA